MWPAQKTCIACICEIAKLVGAKCPFQMTIVGRTVDTQCLIGTRREKVFAHSKDTIIIARHGAGICNTSHPVVAFPQVGFGYIYIGEYNLLVE